MGGAKDINNFRANIEEGYLPLSSDMTTEGLFYDYYSTPDRKSAVLSCSVRRFEERMDEGFKYMVTPLVFDLDLRIESTGYEIETVYGSSEADASTGELMQVNTLFPSKTKNGTTKGGVILLKLKKTGGESQTQVNCLL